MNLQGNRRLRQLLVVGALAVIRCAERHGPKRPCPVQLIAPRTTKLAAVVLANTTARMIWAIMLCQRDNSPTWTKSLILWWWKQSVANSSRV
jgi:transposase